MARQKSYNLTELTLMSWRDWQINAERLCTDILINKWYRAIPQSILWWPDGKKDIFVELSGWNYIWAVYFPTTINTDFKKIKSKFEKDFLWVWINSVDWIIFFTNRHITTWNKKTLQKIWEKNGKIVEIYDLELLRCYLDSIDGIHLRWKYLWIEMTQEEQVTFFTKLQKDSLISLKLNFEELNNYIINCCDDINQKLNSVNEMAVRTYQEISEIRQTLPSNKYLILECFIDYDIFKLTINDIKKIHAKIFNNVDGKELSSFRAQDVYVGNLKWACFTPPSSDKVNFMLESLVSNWNKNISKIKKSDIKNLIKEITKFHFWFLFIHPFLDWNGRVARCILNKQVNILFWLERHVIIWDNIKYYQAIQKAEDGEIDFLEKVISQAIFWQENIY